MALRSAGNPPVIGTEGELTNPTNGTLAADTGAVGADGNYEARFVFTQTANANWNLQRRNAANSGNVLALLIAAAGGLSSEYSILFRLDAGERLRVTNNGGFTGTGQVLIQIERMD